MSKTRFVKVLLDQNLGKPLDYSVPEEISMFVKIGMRVEVPLRNQIVKATICDLLSQSKVPNSKPIHKLISTQEELSPTQWKLAEWMAHYYVASLQKVLKCFIPPFVRNAVKEKELNYLSLARTHADTLAECQKLRTKAPKQAHALELILKEPKGILLSQLLKQGIAKSAVDRLLEKKWLHCRKVTNNDDLFLTEEYFQTEPKTLNLEQEKALKSICASMDQSLYQTHLIYGVTGSGKTEVYLQAIAKALKQNKSVILLVPEIALTSQTIDRFRSRFSEKIAIIHHKRSLGEKTSSWEELKQGTLRIAIGARSAIFAPCKNLGLIIVDEEHDSSYKQSEEAPCYHGRDIAVMRAYLEKCPIILGSATPSIESYYNAQNGKYILHTLKNRATNAHLPQVELIDMKQALDKNGGFTHFSAKLIDEMKERIEQGEQTLLLLNKRGYHRMQLCNSCKTSVKCPHCDISLTFHRKENVLKCHICLFSQSVLRQCPNCHSETFLEFKGFGTEHVERSLHALLPGVRTLRMDRDTTSTKQSHEEIFKQFRSHKADVLIGTQMIAKGFHFPSVTLVGVLGVDTSLHIPDFRSAEHLFQLLTQVAGRAGRAELSGKVILQTFLPEHPLIQMASKHDYESYYQTEIEERKLFGYPPFCHLVKVRCSAKSESEAKEKAEELYSHLKERIKAPTQIFPVFPSGRAKTKDSFHFQFLIKTPKMTFVQEVLKQISPQQTKIDVDPISTFF